MSEKVIKARFDMSLWQRVRAACSVWWAIVVTKEVECIDDEANSAHKDEV
jgi:hypothetical protein